MKIRIWATLLRAYVFLSYSVMRIVKEIAYIFDLHMWGNNHIHSKSNGKVTLDATGMQWNQSFFCEHNKKSTREILCTGNLPSLDKKKTYTYRRDIKDFERTPVVKKHGGYNLLASANLFQLDRVEGSVNLIFSVEHGILYDYTV